MSRQLQYYNENKERIKPLMRERARVFRATPEGKYSEHKNRAKRMGIPFELTFEQWRDIWQKSGHWEERGAHTGGYVMCRYGDIGPYKQGNVFIDTHGNNIGEANKRRASI